MRERYIRDILRVNKLMVQSLLIKDYIMMENYRILLNHTIDCMLEKKEKSNG